MSETKRVPLIAVDVNNKNDNKVSEVRKTLRLQLTLTESNDYTCPILNYKDLARKIEKKEEKKSCVQNGLDPFDNDDDDDADVKRIAKQFEAKYGGQVPKPKKKKNFKDDYTDVGAGYDETDSFIDNTEAYDEIVPESMSPIHGGFYINSGSLEFKQHEVSSPEKSISPVHVQKSRKRLIKSDSEEDSDEEDKDRVEKKMKLTNDIEKRKKTVSTSDDAKDPIKVNKKIINNNDLMKKKPATVKELLKERRDDPEPTVVIDNVKPPEQTNGLQVNAESVNKTPAVNSSSITDVIESVINAVRQPEQEESSKDTTTSKDSGGTPSVSSDSETEERQETPKLPDNLQPELVKTIEALVSESLAVEGKRKFFTDNVNKLLLRLEGYTQTLSKSTCHQVYGYLSSFVGCKRDTILRRAKKLVVEDEKSKLERVLQRLKEAIDRAMPAVLESYKNDCIRVQERNIYTSFFSLAQEKAELPSNIKPKVFRKPKKRFVWNDETRLLLNEIICIQRNCYKLEKVRKDKFEQYLEPFYKSKLVPLWPEGWMKYGTLLKESYVFLLSTEKLNQDIKKVISTISNNLPVPVKADNLTSDNTKQKYPTMDNVSVVLQQCTLNQITNTANSTSVIKPVSLSCSSGITIEPVINKNVNLDKSVKTKSSSPLPTDLSTNSVDKTAKLKSSNDDVKTKPVNTHGSRVILAGSKSTETKNPVISVKKLTDLTNVINETNQTSHSNKTQEHKVPESNTAAIEIIEIDDDDDYYTPSVNSKPTINLDNDKRIQPNTIPNRSELSKVKNPVEIETKRKVAIQPEQSVDPEVLQVMQNLKELQQMTEDRSRDDMIAHKHSPTSVITANTSKYANATAAAAAAAATAANNACLLTGFQDVFQKHLINETKDCSSGSDHEKGSFIANSTDFFPDLASLNSAALPMGVAYSKVLKKNVNALTNQQSSHPGGVGRNDVIRFPNFLYEYKLNKTSGSTQKPPSF